MRKNMCLGAFVLTLALGACGPSNIDTGGGFDLDGENNIQSITLSAPVISAEAISYRSIELTWNQNDNPVGTVMEVQSKTDDMDDFETIYEVPFGAIRYKDESVSELTQYTYRIYVKHSDPRIPEQMSEEESVTTPSSTVETINRGF